MIQIMNSLHKSELEKVFGMMYCKLNNQDILLENFNNILSLRGNLLSKISFYLEQSSPTSRFPLSLDDIDLLLINDTSKTVKTFTSFYCLDELNFFKTLKKIIKSKETLTKDDFNLLNYVIRNKNKVQEIINYSNEKYLSVDKKTLLTIVHLTETRSLTVGHIIDKYESICSSLNYTRETNNPKLQYRIYV